MTTTTRIVTAARPHSPAPPAAARPPARPSAARVASWQAAVALAAAGATRTWWLAVAGGLLLLVTAMPCDGTWLSTVTMRWLRLQGRRRRAFAPLPAVATAEIRGERMGVIVRPDALVAVLRAGRADLATLLGAVRAPAGELRVIQCLRPRPRAWLEVRGPDHVALGNALRRLRRTGLELTPLTGPEIAATAAALLGPGAIREDWRALRAGPITHIGLALAAPATTALQRLIIAARDADLTVAVSAAGPDAGLTGVLRVGTDAAAGRLLALAPGLGIRLHRLDGRHGPAVIASLPIGGTLP